MVYDTGSNSDAGEPSGRNAPPSPSAKLTSRRIFEPADDATMAPGNVAFPEARSLRDDREAALHATAACGVWRDDGLWITECAWCARVRNVTGDWVMISQTTRDAMCVERTHGICPQCSEACIARASSPPPP